MKQSDRDADQEDWDLEIIQTLVSPSSVEEAALACAAAWLNFLNADAVAVAVFESTSQCVVAHGRHDESGHLEINVGPATGHIASLLQPDDLFEEMGGPCSIDSATDVISWPEHACAVLASRDEDAVDDERTEMIKSLSRQLLSRWSASTSAFANPEKMEALAEFAAGAGHEINNPLGSIIGQTQLLLKRSEDAEQKQALEMIGAQAWRIRDMIGDTMLFARPPQPEFTETDLSHIAETVFDSMESKYQDAGVELRIRSPGEPVRAIADPTQLSSMISNLISNSCEALLEVGTDDGQVDVTVSRATEYAVTITIDDDGQPLDEATRQHLFDPFYSGRQAGRGLGFGLCHCWQIIRMHNGILLHEALDNGNRFRVVLPVDSMNSGE